MATTIKNEPEALNSGPPIEDRQSQSAVSNVQSQIDLLGDLNKRLQSLRQLPGGVIRSELASGPNQVLQTLTLKDIFGKSAEDLRTLHAAAIEGKVQDALKAAAESEQRDGTEIRDFHERDSRKRRYAWHLLFLLSRFCSFPPTFPPLSLGIRYVVVVTVRGAEPIWYNIAAALPPPNHRGRVYLYSRRSRSHFPRFQRAHYHSRSKTYRHTSWSSTRDMRRRCCCTFTWNPGTGHTVSPFL